VITFGAPAPIYTKDSAAVNPIRNYRFWSALAVASSLTYDVIVNMNSAGTHYGHAYLLSDDGDLPVYLGLKDHVKTRQLMS